MNSLRLLIVVALVAPAMFAGAHWAQDYRGKNTQSLIIMLECDGSVRVSGKQCPR